MARHADTNFILPTTGFPPPACDDDMEFLNELNNFFGRFESLNNSPAVKSIPHQVEKALCHDIAEVQMSLRSVNSRKALGPDNKPGECSGNVHTQITN